jgi:hypothetical protein
MRNDQWKMDSWKELQKRMEELKRKNVVKPFHKTTITAGSHFEFEKTLPAWCVTYHSMVIVEFQESGIILNSGGHRTATTKKRMNQFLPFQYRIIQTNFNWFVEIPANFRKQPLPPIPFVDGMKLPWEHTI